MTWIFLILAFAVPREALSFSRNELMLEIEEEVQRFSESAESLIPAGEKLTVRLDSLNPAVNAEIIKDSSGPVIHILGGMMVHSKMTSTTMTMLLCHELGHYLGGPPLKSRTGWSSTEGQADYFSGLVCARLLGLSEDELIEGAINLTKIYSDVSGEAYPHMDASEETRVQRTNYGYPSSQCRLDTILAGWNGEPRPACWFVE
jgi:hypothetical protein